MQQNKALIFWCTGVTMNQRSTTCGFKHASLGSQFFRTATGIKLGLENS